MSAETVDHQDHEMSPEEHFAISLAATVFTTAAGSMMMLIMISLLLQSGT